MVAFEIKKRYPGVEVRYVDVNENEDALPELVRKSVDEKEFHWPVTAVSGIPQFDGLPTLPQMVKLIDSELALRNA